MSRVGAASLLTVGVALAAHPALAQTVEMTTQDVFVDISQPSLHVEITARFTSPDGVDETYVLRPTLPVTSVSVDGESIALGDYPGYPQVATLPFGAEGLAAGATTEVRVVLDGAPTCAGGRYAACAHEPGLTALLPSSQEFTWYLQDLTAIDPVFTGTIRVRAPAAMAVLAGQGAEVASEPRDDGTVDHTFAVASPAAGLFVHATVGDFVRHERDGAAMLALVPGDARADERAQLDHLLDVGASVLDVYSDAFGALPLDEVHVAILPSRFWFAGLGLLGNVLLADLILSPDYSYLVEQGIAHELAHSYWGNLLRPLEPNEGLVMNEGLAEYSAWRALGVLQGDAARTSGARMSSVWYMYGRPGDEDIAALDRDIQSSPVAVHVGYHKASQAWRTIAEAAGEDGFARTLASLAASARAVTVDELVAELRTETGYDAAPDVTAWLRSTGFPRIRATATATDGAGETCLDLVVEGEPTLRLPIVARASDGTGEEQIAEVAAGEHHVCVPTDGAPAAIEIDPRWTMTREVRPAVEGDVTIDGILDAADIVDAALRVGTALPEERRRDGRYDPFYDVDEDRDVDADDLARVEAAVRGG